MRAAASRASSPLSTWAKATVRTPASLRKVFSATRSWATARARPLGATGAPRAFSRSTAAAGTFSNS